MNLSPDPKLTPTVCGFGRAGAREVKMEKEDSADPIGLLKARRIRRWIAGIAACIICALFAPAADLVQTGLANSRLRSMAMDAFFDPARNFLDASVRLRFADPAPERCLFLAEGLEVNSVYSGSKTKLNFKQDSGLLFVQGQGEMELELRYSGRLVRDQDPIDASASRDIPELPTTPEDCYFLSYLQDFYPHPKLDFIPLQMSICIPDEWNCLGSGRLLGVEPESAFRTYRLENAQAKGMTLVVGRFHQLGLVAGSIPIRLHGWPTCNYQDYFTDAGMARALSFLVGHFGPLDLPELNVLFRSGRNFSGISFNGLVVLNLEEASSRFSAGAAKKPQAESMFSVIDAKTDLLIHELAHQWWGGLVSWKTSADNCITEGLATFSTLLYLRESRGEKAYRKTLKRLNQQLKRYADLGVPAQGVSLKLISRDRMAYQALVYVKPALMLAALADKLGETELLFRLRAILAQQRGCNLDTAEFLSRLSAGDRELSTLMGQWLFKRGLPPAAAGQ
jgi:hypothetical protein